MSQVILAEYGRAKTINFDLYEVDGVDFRVDAADAGADCSIMKDEGVEGTCANDFVDEGQSYSLVLTAAEMQAKRATILIVDSATKVWLDKHIYIETYGHLSSAHPFMTPYWTNGAVNDVSASSTVWTFDGFTEATADHVIGSELTFTSGANAGQCRTVTDYTSTVITVAPAFLAAPADNDEFVLKAAPTTSAGKVPAIDISDILIDTAEIGTAGAGLGDLGGMSTGMKAEVEAEGTDALVAMFTDAATLVNLIWDEAMVETTGAPAVTGSMRLFMSWWAGLSRNKATQTATTSILRNDADDGDLATSTVSDDGTTFVRGEWST